MAPSALGPFACKRRVVVNLTHLQAFGAAVKQSRVVDDSETWGVRKP
jgi:hypothetical protein